MFASIRIIIAIVLLICPVRNTYSEITLPFEPLEIEKELLKLKTKDIKDMEKSLCKIGKVNLQRALNESVEGKGAKKELEFLIKSKQSMINEKGKVIEKLKAEIEKSGNIKGREEGLEKLLREYQKLVKDSQDEVKGKEKDLTEKLIGELKNIIGTKATREKYDLIVEAQTESFDSFAIFSKKGFVWKDFIRGCKDVTDEVIEEYNSSKR